MLLRLTGNPDELADVMAYLCSSQDWDIARFGVQIRNQLHEYLEREVWTTNHSEGG